MKREVSWKISIYLLSFILTVLYIIYRVFFTIPTNNNIDIIFALLVLIIEIIDALFFTFYVFNILVFNKNSPSIPKINSSEYPDVDIFIATINEDSSLLTKNIKACKSLKYPDKKKLHIYVCDDGNRKDIRDLCKKLNVNYITRKDNINAKAGNYNNALKLTNSPYIAMFDADMCPNNTFLKRTIPFFIKEENVGFVQLPQSFKELDFFQSKFKLLNKIPLEQDYFYHNIQMAKNNTNSVVCCGTNMVISRKALEDIGGFATKTITEDIATGMLIESAGYKSIAISSDEVYGLNVKSTDQLIKQRSRWCRGCIQVLKNYNILFNKKLSIRQKLDYLSAIYYWFYGIRNIIYLLVPLLFSIFDIRVVECNVYIFLLLFTMQYILKRFIIDYIEDKKISSTWNRIYEIILSPIIAYQSIKELIGLGNRKFDVTSKDNNISNKTSKNTIILYLSHLVLFLLTFIGIILSLYKGYNLGLNIYYIPLYWLCTNFIFLTIALIFDSSKMLLESNKNNIKNYKFNSIPLIFINFFKHEFKYKEWGSLIILIVFFIVFINQNFTKLDLNTNVNKNLVSYNNNLHIKNGQIVNENNELVQLRGVSTHNLYYYGNLYNYPNIKSLVDNWGINVFRIAVYTNPDDEGYIKNKELMRNIDQIINDCINLNIYVIIDWHILSDNNPNTYKEEAISFFNEMSFKYRDVPNIIYEICNEPNGEEVTWDNEIKPYAEDIIKTIRNNSEDSLILVGTPNWSKDIISVRDNLLSDKNTMYVLHAYPEGGMDIIDSGIDIAQDEKIPIIITECAPTNPTGDGELYKDEFKNLIKELERKNISWVVWQLSDKNESSSLLKKSEYIDDIYDINSNLSPSGKFIKNIITQYSK